MRELLVSEKNSQLDFILVFEGYIRISKTAATGVSRYSHILGVLQNKNLTKNSDLNFLVFTSSLCAPITVYFSFGNCGMRVVNIYISILFIYRQMKHLKNQNLKNLKKCQFFLKIQNLNHLKNLQNCQLFRSIPMIFHHTHTKGGNRTCSTDRAGLYLNEYDLNHYTMGQYKIFWF